MNNIVTLFEANEGVSRENFNNRLKDINKNAVSVEDIIPINKGGTGASSAMEARSNLGAGVADGLATLDANGKVVAIQSSSAIADTVTGDFTLALAHAGEFIAVNTVEDCVVTIPSSSQVEFYTGCEIEFCRLGVGGVAFLPANGVLLVSVDGQCSIGNQFGCVCLKKIDSSTWLLAGDLG